MASLSDYENEYLGERIFIVGNGPSLQKTPLHLLEDEYCTGMNRIDLIYNETSWRPSFYFQLNDSPRPEQDINSANTHIDLDIPCFFNKELKKNFGKEKNVFYLNVEKTNNEFLHNKANNGDYSNIWSTNVKKVVYAHSTTLYAVSQVAAYMGFDEIYFVGCDLYPVFKPAQLLPTKLTNRGRHPRKFILNSKSENGGTYIDYLKFSINSINPISTLTNGIWFKFRTHMIELLKYFYQVMGKVDETHFSSDYRSYKYYEQYMNKKLEDVHVSIESIGESEGFECYNATFGGNLNAHDRKDIQSLAKNSKN